MKLCGECIVKVVWPLESDKDFYKLKYLYCNYVTSNLYVQRIKKVYL